MQGDYTDEELIDVIEGNRIYIPAIYVCNKIDQITLEELTLLDRMPHYCPISAHLVRAHARRHPAAPSARVARCARASSAACAPPPHVRCR